MSMRNKEKYFLFLQPYDLKQSVKSAKDEKPNLQPPLTFHDLGKTKYDVKLALGSIVHKNDGILEDIRNYRDF